MALINTGAQITLRLWHPTKFNQRILYNLRGLLKRKIDRVRCLSLLIRTISWPKFPMIISTITLLYPIVSMDTLTQ